MFSWLGVFLLILGRPCGTPGAGALMEGGLVGKVLGVTDLAGEEITGEAGLET